MATVIDELLIELGLDAGELESEIDNAARDVTMHMDRITDDAERAGRSIDQAGADAFSGVDSQADQAGRSLLEVGDDADRAAREVGAAGDRAGREFRVGIESDLNRAGNAFDGLEADARQAGDKIGNAGQEGGSGFVSNVTSSFGGIGSKLSEIAGTAMASLKSAFAAGGAAAGGALLVSITESMEREMSADKLVAQLGLSPKEAERVGKISGELYAGAWGDSRDEVNTALQSIITSIGGLEDITDDELSKAGQHALDFANIFDVDVAEATGAAGILVKNDLARDWDEAFDLMTVAMRKIPAAYRDELIPATEEYSTFLGDLGFDGAEMFGIILAASEKAGTFGIDKSMDALKGFQDLATEDTTPAVVAAFETIGLDAGVMADRILAGGDTAQGALEDVAEGLLAIEDPSEQAEAAIALFGEPLIDLGKENIPEFLESLLTGEDALGDFSGAIEQAGDDVNDNFGTKLESVKRTVLDKLASFLDEQLVPALQKVGDVFRDDIQPHIQPVLDLLAKTFAFFREHPAILQTVIMLAALALAFFVLTNPLTIVLVFIGIFITIIEKLGDVLEGVATWIAENWPALQQILTDPIGTAAMIIGLLWNQIRNIFQTSISIVVGFVRTIPGRIQGALASLAGVLLGIARRAWNLFHGAVVDNAQRVIGFVAGLPGRIIGALGSFRNLLWSAGKALMDGLLEGIKAAWENVKDFVGGIAGQIKDLKGPLPDDLKLLTDEGAAIMAGLQAGIETGSLDVFSTVSGIAPSIGDSMGTPSVPALDRVGGGPTIVVNQTVQGSIRSERDIIELIRNELNFGGLRGTIR